MTSTKVTMNDDRWLWIKLRLNKILHGTIVKHIDDTECSVAYVTWYQTSIIRQPVLYPIKSVIKVQENLTDL